MTPFPSQLGQSAPTFGPAAGTASAGVASVPRKKSLLARFFGGADAKGHPETRRRASQVSSPAAAAISRQASNHPFKVASSIRPASPVRDTTVIDSPFGAGNDRQPEASPAIDGSGVNLATESVNAAPKPHFKADPAAMMDRLTTPVELVPPASMSGLERSGDNDLLIKRHDELIDSVNEMCRILEDSQNRKVEVSLTDVLPSPPSEGSVALSRSQKEMSLALGEICSRLESASNRDDQVVDTMVHVDGSLGKLAKISERSSQTMEGLKVVLGDVNESLETVRSEVRLSSTRYEKLNDRVREAGIKQAASIVQIQRRAFRLNAFLGVGVLGALVAVIVLLVRQG